MELFFRDDDNEYKEFLCSVDSALSTQSLALPFTAIIQAFKSQLSFFHAICEVHLLALLADGLSSMDPDLRLGTHRKVLRTFLALFSIVAFMTFNVYLWVTAPKFGSQPDCNSSTIYVYFGTDVIATQGLAWAVAMLFTMAFPLWFLSMRLLFGSTFWCLSFRGCLGYNGDDKSKKRRPFKQTVRLLLHMGLCIYLIASLEQMITRNHVGDGEKDWTFGQILTLFLPAQTANKFVNALLSRRETDPVMRHNYKMAVLEPSTSTPPQKP